MSNVLKAFSPASVLSYLWIIILSIALLTSCTYCLYYQAQLGGINLEIFWRWFFTNPLPLALTALVARQIAHDKLRLVVLGLLATVLILFADLIAFPPNHWSMFEILGRGESKLSIVITYVALGAILFFPISPEIDKCDDHSVDIRTLLSAEALKGAGNYIEAFSGKNCNLVRMTMKDAEKKLIPEGYVRVHRSWIVKTDFISEVCRTRDGLTGLQLKCGRRVPIGRSYRKNLGPHLIRLPVIRP